MHSVRFKILGVIIAFTLSSCSRNDYFAFDNVIYADRFQQEYSVSNAEVLEIDAIGINGIKVFDDFLLVSSSDSSGCMSAFGADGQRISLPFLKTGRGPGEVLYRPFISWMDFNSNSDDRIVAGLFDFKGNYIEYDVTRTLETAKPVWRCVVDSLSLSSGARYFRIDDEHLLCRRRNEYDSGYERYIESKSEGCYSNPAMEHLNSVTSSEINLLSTHFLVNHEKSMVAELGSRLNSVNLYSLESDFKTTIALGRSLVNIRDEEMKSQEEMSKVYYDAKAYKDFFVGLYLGTPLRELDEGSFPAPKLHFFGWDGSPMADISLPVRALFFDIDIIDNELYIVEYETERILKYDISDILNSDTFKNLKDS